MQTVIDLLTSPAVVTILVTLGVAILDAIAAAMAGTHPLLAQLLVKLANLLRANTTGDPPMKLPPLLLALAIVPLFACDSQAGPLRDWIRARRSGGCAGWRQPAPSYYAAPCQACAPQYAAPGACFNCTSCAGGCNCFGGGYYCCDGRCPVTFAPRPLTAFPVYQPPNCPSCQGGSCPAPARPGLFRR